MHAQDFCRTNDVNLREDHDRGITLQKIIDFPSEAFTVNGISSVGFCIEMASSRAVSRMHSSATGRKPRARCGYRLVVEVMEAVGSWKRPRRSATDFTQ